MLPCLCPSHKRKQFSYSLSQRTWYKDQVTESGLEVRPLEKHRIQRRSPNHQPSQGSGVRLNYQSPEEFPKSQSPEAESSKARSPVTREHGIQRVSLRQTFRQHCWLAWSLRPQADLNGEAACPRSHSRSSSCSKLIYSLMQFWPTRQLAGLPVRALTHGFLVPAINPCTLCSRTAVSSLRTRAACRSQTEPTYYLHCTLDRRNMLRVRHHVCDKTSWHKAARHF